MVIEAAYHVGKKSFSSPAKEPTTKQVEDTLSECQRIMLSKPSSWLNVTKVMGMIETFLTNTINFFLYMMMIIISMLITNIQLQKFIIILTNNFPMVMLSRHGISDSPYGIIAGFTIIMMKQSMLSLFIPLISRPYLK